MKKGIKRIVLLLITLLFLYLVFLNLDFKELLQIIKEFDVKYAFFLAISITIALSFRGLCFKQLISKTVDAPLKDLVPLCITGAALNIVLPARAGDIFRAYYVGHKYDVDKVKIFGTIMLERIFDGLIILSMLLFGIYAYHKNELAQKLCIAAAVIFVGALICAIIAMKFNKIDLVCSVIEEKTNFLPSGIKKIFHSILNFINRICNSFVAGFEILAHPKKLVAVMFSSLCIWSFECLNYFLIIQGFGCDVDWSVVLFIIGFIALACMIPSTSIFIGPYQFAVIAAFAIYDISKETALAISLVEQAIVIIVTSLIAVLFLLKNNISYKELKEDIK
ncbi:flippase-like domain-containing protein [bacterium]|nr:flippase-like domain-containing protein [bacterium]